MMHIAPPPVQNLPLVRPSLTTLPQSACRWPIGDPRSPAFGYCGAPAAGRYCASHAARGRASAQPGAAFHGVEGLGGPAEPVRFASHMDRWA